VLTDNGTHFNKPTGNGWTPQDIMAMHAEGVVFCCRSFEAVCGQDIEHRLTEPTHPDQRVGRAGNRTIKDAADRHHHNDDRA